MAKELLLESLGNGIRFAELDPEKLDIEGLTRRIEDREHHLISIVCRNPYFARMLPVLQEEDAVLEDGKIVRILEELIDRVLGLFEYLSVSVDGRLVHGNDRQATEADEVKDRHVRIDSPRETE